MPTLKQRARNRVVAEYLVYGPDYVPFTSELLRYRTKARAFRKALALGDGSMVKRSVEYQAYHDRRRPRQFTSKMFTDTHIWDLRGGHFFEDRRAKALRRKDKVNRA